MLLSKLKVEDEAFLVESLIERCPRRMMLRELFMNAVEAALQASPGSRRIEIGAVTVDGVPKLRLWNAGPGLSADELLVMGDLSASVRKTKTSSLGGNLGIGAKVASLGANPLGVRYRFCRDGRVHEMTLGRRDGRYGRLLVSGPDGRPQPVVEVTAAAAATGADLSFDWTEVVTLGARNRSGHGAAALRGGQPGIDRLDLRGAATPLLPPRRQREGHAGTRGQASRSGAAL